MASTTLNFPPLDFSLLFPDLVNFHMERNSSFPIFVYPSANAPDSLTEISFLEFGRAAHRIAHAIRPSRQGSDGEVVMIIANTDSILYQAVTVGLFVAGWVPFPTSPRNSAAAVVNMMKKTNCSRIITLHHAHSALIDGVRREYGEQQLTVFELPTLRYAFPKLGKEVAGDAFAPYPSALRRPDLDSPAIYIHSSGSTGFPKPIAHTHRIQIEWARRRSLYPQIHRVPISEASRYHGASSIPCFWYHVRDIRTVRSLGHYRALAPRTEHDPLAQPVIPTSDNMIECLKRVPCNSLMAVPTLLEPMASSRGAIEILKKLDSVVFSGGPLPIKVGEALADAGVRLDNLYGGTEFGILTSEPDRRETGNDAWLWMRFEDEPKLRWAPQGDGSYELQVLTSETQHMAVENLADTKGYATSDVFVKHPTKDLWRIVGRADDVITLASGEKTVPAPMESIIGSSPLVQGVVMFGRERNQVGVLIEPSPTYGLDLEDEQATSEYMSQIWPAIEEANKISPAFSRIFKEMILITSGDKPLARTPKGTIQRKVALKAYETEINTLYDTVEASSGSLGPSEWTYETLKEWLLENARFVSPSGHVDPDTDLFAQGFDSLSATYLRNKILGALRTSSDPNINQTVSHVHPNVIFEYPTIQLLSSWLVELIKSNGAAPAQDFVEQHKQAINAMIEKYAVCLDGPDDGVLASSQGIEPAVVLLTGSTGGLGCSLLYELLNSPAVQRVYAYNRPSSKKSIQERQISGFKERGFSVELLSSSKLVYVEADASQKRCGLSTAQYEEIRESVTLIIHNAWRLDFNLALSSFEDNIRASRNLVDLALDSPRRGNLRFLFTSSIATAQSWKNSKGAFPEQIQLDPSVAVGLGYGEGKYVTERIVAKSGLHATSFRIGQIVGGERDGYWATTDWFPIIVKSSIALGALPGSAGVASWIRQEEVANAILETAFAKESPPPALNIFNPRGAPWADIMAFVRRAIVKRKELGDDVLPIIPLEEWFRLLEKKAENASEEDLTNIPAIKLLEFIRGFVQGEQEIGSVGGSTEAGGMTTLSTDEIRRVSATMANMRAIGEAEADAWVGYWISKGAF